MAERSMEEVAFLVQGLSGMMEPDDLQRFLADEELKLRDSFPWKQFGSSVKVDQREVFYSLTVSLFEEEVAGLDEVGFKSLLREKMQREWDAALEAWRERGLANGEGMG